MDQRMNPYESDQFSEIELLDLTMGILNINSYNRINVAFRTKAGTYYPGEHAVAISQN